MKLFLLEPEVAGYVVESPMGLEHIFDGWLGDELIATFPYFLITNNLLNNLLIEKISGYSSRAIGISKSDIFNEIYEDKTLPGFVEMLIEGRVILENNVIKYWDGKDVCLSQTKDLVVSEKVFSILNKKIIYCDVFELTN